jgi:hypothetical protein
VAGQQGGVALDSFRVVGEFVASFKEGTLAAEDRTVHGDQPLVILVEATLESVSRAHLSTPIAGLNSASAQQLIDQRRLLENADELEPLQLLLYAFEHLCELVQFAGYHSAGGDNDTDFFQNAFPDFLSKVAGWGASNNYDELASTAAGARAVYLPVAGLIVVPKSS